MGERKDFGNGGGKVEGRWREGGGKEYDRNGRKMIGKERRRKEKDRKC